MGLEHMHILADSHYDAATPPKSIGSQSALLTMRVEPANLLFGGEESRPSCAQQPDLAELRKDDSHVQVEQAEGADDYESSVEQEADNAIAGGPWLVVLAVWRRHCCIHRSCKNTKMLSQHASARCCDAKVQSLQCRVLVCD